MRSAHDREILRLALPALGALAAEPLYVLVDTAIVGHLGTRPLAALAIAATLLTASFTLFNFLTYGTTAQVARLAALRPQAAARLGAQALWLAVAIGAALALLAAAFAHPAAAALGGAGRTASMAATYLRIAALGLPFAMVALAGQGYLRGIANMRTPLAIVVAGNVANVLIELLLVYGLGLGIAGSAWGTVAAQAGMGAAFALALLRAPADTRRPSLALMRPLVRVGREIFVRTAALYASFVVASAVLARIGAASLAAHQIAFQLWSFLALVLDAVAIAGQVIVGRALGAGDGDGAYAASVRMIGWSTAIGAALGAVLLGLGDLVPRAFTSDPAVVAHAGRIWALFCLMQPLNGAAFALDGILIGASDTRFLMVSMVAAALGVFVPIALASLALGWGIAGVWAGLVALIAVRLAATGVRFLTRRWAATGLPETA